MMGEQRELKVIPLVDSFVGQVTSAVNDDTAACWSAVRYNANNPWYVNTSNGNVNNNNSYNRYSLLPCPLSSVELLFSMMLDAEVSCYKNKHSSLEACRIHYHLSELYKYAEAVYNEGLSVGRCKCFVLDYPVYREVFCAQYFDRIMHHMIAPLMSHIADVIHDKVGDISHGNRIGHSAFTAAMSIQDKLRKITNGWTEKAWVATRDYSGFFMSIPRKMAADVFRKYAGMILGLNDTVNSYLVDVVCLYLMTDPTKDCIRLSPISKWSYVPENKSLFTSNPGHGLPIGNFPSQIMANLYRAVVDYFVNRINGVECVVFVDDRMLCSRNQDTLKEAISLTENRSNECGLVTNKRKCYMQQVDKGVKFCGYVIKCDRIYISNRVVKAAMRLLRLYDGCTDIQSEAKLAQRINSYIGLMSRTRSMKIQKKIMNDVISKHKTLYFVSRNNHLVCRQKKKYTPLYTSIMNIEIFKHGVHWIQSYYKNMPM